VVLLVGHPVGALAEAAEVGREHDVAVVRELVCVRGPFVVLFFGQIANARLAGTMAVDGEHRRPALDAFVGNEQVRRNRHRRFRVEHDALAPVRAAIDALGYFEIQGHRLGCRSEHRDDAVAHPCAPRVDLRGIVDGAGIGVDGRVVPEPPVRPVGEVARAGHAEPSAHSSPPARWRR
jgi:hypothetical protein